MSRLFLTLLSSLIILLPSSVIAGEGPSEKAKIVALYKAYKASLKAGDDEGALTSAEQMYALTPGAYGKISKTHATATFNLVQMIELMHHKKNTAQLYQEHIDILDELKVPKDERYLWKLGLLSDAYRKAEERNEAVVYAKKALKLAKKLKVSEELLADYELKMGITYNAPPYSHFRKAKGHFKTAYELRVKIYSEDHLKTAEVIRWQANYHLFKNNYSKAVDYYGRVLNIYRGKLNPDDERIRQLYFVFERVYRVMGDHANAYKYADLIQKEFPSTEPPDYLPIVKVAPIYPKAALRRNLSGYVILDFTVDIMGAIKDAKVIESSNRIFNIAALKAVKKFHYFPKVKDGKPIETVNVKHKVTFEIGH